MTAYPDFPCRKIKYVATINDETLSEDTDPSYELQYVDIGNVDSSGQMHDIVTYSFSEAPSRARRRVRDGDVIVSCVRTYLQAIAPIQHPPDNLIVSTGFAVVRPSLGVLGTFAKYALREPSFLAEVERRSVGVNYPTINTSDLRDITVHLPDAKCQAAIANYLDRKTARLDALVVTKERVLALLAEKRQAIITRAVTRGLDSHAVLRKSGIPWLGEIPSHWDIWKLGHLSTIGNGSTPSRLNAAYWSNGTIPWLSSSVVGQHEVTEATQFVTEAALRECQLTEVKKGSVLVGIVGQGKTRGAATVLSIDATINQNLAHISPVSTLVDPWYLRWTLFTAYEHLRSISDDGGRAKGTLTCDNLANLKVAIPPLGEQRQIVAHIANDIRKLDRLLVLIKMTTELLKERRAALISDAVSGQLDVDRAAGTSKRSS